MQNSYHIDNLAHFDANLYCAKCLRKRFFTYYQKIPINLLDELLAQVFSLIYTDKSFKEELKGLLAKYIRNNNLTLEEIQQLKKEADMFLVKLLSSKPLRNKLMEEVYHHLRSLKEG